jgi:hypothetical protein
LVESLRLCDCTCITDVRAAVVNEDYKHTATGLTPPRERADTFVDVDDSSIGDDSSNTIIESGDDVPSEAVRASVQSSLTDTNLVIDIIAVTDDVGAVGFNPHSSVPDDTVDSNQNSAAAGIDGATQVADEPEPTGFDDDESFTESDSVAAATVAASDANASEGVVHPAVTAADTLSKGGGAELPLAMLLPRLTHATLERPKRQKGLRKPTRPTSKIQTRPTSESGSFDGFVGMALPGVSEVASERAIEGEGLNESSSNNDGSGSAASNIKRKPSVYGFDEDVYGGDVGDTATDENKEKEMVVLIRPREVAGGRAHRMSMNIGLELAGLMLKPSGNKAGKKGFCQEGIFQIVHLRFGL